ncbi:MAG: hypothetical protein Q9174_002479 [Haloplaca sp. 1 TL-2023]
MFQYKRLKGAIDSRIAEEQARQRSALTSPPPPASSRGASPRTQSPAQRTRRPAVSNRQHGEASGRGPDPSEFEPEFVIEDSDVPSRSATPRPAATKSDGTIKNAVEQTLDEPSNGETPKEESLPDDRSPAPQDLPTDVRVKLRKLEKLESRYNELLRSYRIAHARVQTVDSFEASLRENTPLTTISDPRALVEYLNQLNLKGDMVVDELKRVTHDRDTYKNELDKAEQRAKDAWDEVKVLRNDNKDSDIGFKRPDPEDDAFSVQSPTVANPTTEQPSAVVVKSPVSPAKSRTGSLPSLSIFSPKAKPVESPVINEVREDLFSYDDEIPRLQSEAKVRESKIEKLEGEVTTLKGDLAVTRESTQSMVQTLEETTRELNSLRDYRDRSTVELKEQQEASKQVTDRLRADLKIAETQLQEAKVATETEDTSRSAQVERELQSVKTELQELRSRPKHNDDQADESKTLQERIEALEKEIAEARANEEQSGKKVNTLDSLLKKVRGQLAHQEQNHAIMLQNSKESDDSLRDRIEELEREIETQQIVYNAKSHAGDTGTNLPPKLQRTEDVPHEPVEGPAATKKKSKKKKKGGKTGPETTAEGQTIPSETPKTSGAHEDEGIFKTAQEVVALRHEVAQLRGQLSGKDAAADDLRTKLKDQDGLKEEIETLKESLSDYGEECVAAKAKAKELQIEKEALQKTISELERELTDMQGSNASSNASADQKHQDLSAQFEDLRHQATTLQTDLSAAQQLATSRFKELSDLRSNMQKTQPELSSLRNEVGELRAIKEAHDQKGLQLRRLETRQEEMRNEITAHQRTVADRDTEITSLSQKLAQESSSRSRADEGRSKAMQDIQRLETEKRQANESLDQLSQELSRARDEIIQSRSKLKDLEREVTQLKRDTEGMKEETDLKTAQYASAQSLMMSMRDQTSEMAVQMKEARDRCESLEEEVADAHRLLSERSREGETMRRLLADVEGKTDARMRDMKERMDTAMEERDRAEDEASTAARRRTRELDELRNKVREAERGLKRAEDDKEELEAAQRDWKRRREELEQRSGQSSRDAEEVRRAMAELRDALDGSEKQAREAEKQKAELRRSVEETQHRLEKLQKSNKSMADEIRMIQSARTRGMDSDVPSSRSSSDFNPSQARLASPGPGNGQSTAGRPVAANGQASASGAMDFVYLKNVLLQFLEQKDKNHQKQLIPVLGMLLHFDRKDEQRWMSAITSK